MDERIAKEVGKRLSTKEDISKINTKLTGEFKRELIHILNRHGIDSSMGIPDWILADSVVFSLLNTITTITKLEANWFGSKLGQNNGINTASN